MKKSIYVLITTLVFTAVLTACGGDTATAVLESSGGSASLAEATSPTAVIEAVAGSNAALSTGYAGALPVEMQLAFGTMQLENTNLAVTARQAEALLPYWRVLQSLTQSDTAADAEINAVVKQIQDNMDGEQIAAIAAMELSEEKLQTMIEEGTLNFGGRGLGANEGGSGGGFRPGGGPGSGMLGGGGPGGGGPGGFGGDPGAFATRQAELEASGEDPTAVLMARMSSNMVIRLLETKTGQAPQRGIGAALAAAAELSGLSQEELGQAMAEGQTLGEILEANGVSTEAAREVMTETMVDIQLPEGQDLDQFINSILSGTLGARQDAGDQ
jgi:hypothetical protein